MKKYAFSLLFSSLLAMPYYAHAADTPSAPPAIESTDGMMQKEKPAIRHQKKSEVMDALPAAVKEEIQKYRKERQELYKNLSDDAKKALKDLRMEKKKRHAMPQKEPMGTMKDNQHDDILPPPEEILE